jgi:hypothetical protein
MVDVVTVGYKKSSYEAQGTFSYQKLSKYMEEK